MTKIDEIKLISRPIDTPIGTMLAVADTRHLYMLDFLEGAQEKLDHLPWYIEEGELPLLDQVTKELKLYFQRELRYFSLPLFYLGTPFQEKVWNELKRIPFGETRSYAQIASSIKKPLAVRPAASANGKNKLAIIIPCHRVIQSNGLIGGYNGGIERKRWLLAHEGVML